MLQGGVRRAAAAVVVALLVVAAGTVAALDVTGRLRGGLVADPTPTPPVTAPVDPARSPAPVVLPDVPTDGTPPALATASLDAVLDARSLGGAAAAAVVDVATGQVLYERDATAPRIPASLTKLVTAAAVLQAYPPGHRLETRVLAGPAPGEVVLVGAGDATLTREPTSEWPRPASVSALADQVTAALTADGAVPPPVTVRVDDGLFTGPPLSPSWRPGYVGFGVVAPVAALSVDGGRVRTGAPARSPDPALAAGESLAAMLRARGLTVAGPVARAGSDPAAQVLGAVASPTVAELVEHMLQTSDNYLSEALLRLAAVAAGRTADFAGGTQTAMDTLTGLGLPTDGVRLFDGSGLARGNRLPPSTLAALLRLAADGSHPSLGPVLDGLPVAGFSGTLADRFGRRGPGPGLVRAKTGTLTGVSSLAGTTTVSGRPVVFAVMTDAVPVPRTLQARADLDRFAALLSSGAPPGAETTAASGD